MLPHSFLPGARAQVGGWVRGGLQRTGAGLQWYHVMCVRRSVSQGSVVSRLGP